jgi:ABC-type transporter Mla subunit MlaD
MLEAPPAEAPLGPTFQERVDTLEAERAGLAHALSQHAAAIDQTSGIVNEMQKALQRLLQQRAVAEQQMERQSRYSALDLAIKAAGERPEIDAITAFAGAFLDWMKAGTQ